MAELDPQIAEKVLSANMRNVVKKVGDGDVLPASERELVEKQRVASVDSGTIEKERIASILRLYAQGKTLTKSQTESIQHLLPEPQLQATKRTRTKYNKQLVEYEEIFQIKSNNGRTIKRWISLGKQKEPIDLPPLDEPQLMASWWARNMKNRVPERLLSFASKQAPDLIQPTAPRKIVPSEIIADVPLPIRPELSIPEGSGFMAALDRARQAERTAYASWQAELAKVELDAGAEEMRHRAWQRAVETVRKLEKDAESIMASDGAFVRKDEYDQEVGESLSVMNQSLRSIVVRIATKIGLPDEWFRKVEKAYHGELDRVFAILDKNEWTEPFELTNE